MGILLSYINIFPHGEVSGFLAAQDVYTDAATDGCENFEYGIFDAGSVTLENSAVGSDCDDAVGDFYDPTHQCPFFPGSETLFLNETVGPDTLLPLIGDLDGKVMAIYCSEDDQAELTVFACAPINTFDALTTEEPGDSAS